MTKGLASYWRKIPQRYNLIGTVCTNCDTKFFPPRDFCSICRRHGKIQEFKFSGRGEIYSYSVVHAPPEGFEYQKPYIIGIIKLEEGPKLTAQIVDCKPEDVSIGKKVKSVFRKIVEVGRSGIIQYGYKFKLAD
jgi:hypothetical protein